MKMSQQEVLIFLKKHKNKWYTRRELSKKLKLTLTTMNNNVKQLLKWNKNIEEMRGRSPLLGGQMCGFIRYKDENGHKPEKDG